MRKTVDRGHSYRIKRHELIRNVFEQLCGDNQLITHRDHAFVYSKDSYLLLDSLKEDMESLRVNWSTSSTKDSPLFSIYITINRDIYITCISSPCTNNITRSEQLLAMLAAILKEYENMQQSFPRSKIVKPLRNKEDNKACIHVDKNIFKNLSKITELP